MTCHVDVLSDSLVKYICNDDHVIFIGLIWLGNCNMDIGMFCFRHHKLFCVPYVVTTVTDILSLGLPHVLKV